jgi:hypothetical protein
VALCVLLRRRVGASPSRPPRHPVEPRRGRLGADRRPDLPRRAAERRRHRRQARDDRRAAGAYAAAVVAAKLVVGWRSASGCTCCPRPPPRRRGLDPRPCSAHARARRADQSVARKAIFALVPSLLLRLAFGEDFTPAADALILLGAAMSLLAVAYLAVQYMLALRQTAFLWILGIVAIAEPFLLTSADFGLVSFAAAVLLVQGIAATGALTLGLRRPQPA